MHRNYKSLFILFIFSCEPTNPFIQGLLHAPIYLCQLGALQLWLLHFFKALLTYYTSQTLKWMCSIRGAETRQETSNMVCVVICCFYWRFKVKKLHDSVFPQTCPEQRPSLAGPEFCFRATASLYEMEKSANTSQTAAKSLGHSATARWWTCGERAGTRELKVRLENANSEE